MRHTLLAAALLFAVPALAAQRDYGYRANACEKKCMGRHDASVIGCKMFKTPAQSEDCVANARLDREACEEECHRRARERQSAEDRRERDARPSRSEPREDRDVDAEPERFAPLKR